MKKLLTSLCVIALALVCLLVLPTRAEAAVEDNYAYGIANGGATITRYNGPGGAVSIPSQLGGYPVTTIGEGAFYLRTEVTSVVIPNTVKIIEEDAFAVCNNIKQVYLGSGLEIIGDTAFRTCTNLSEVIIPATVKSVGERAFWNCTGMTYLVIPDGVTEIGAAAFMYCSSLEEVAVPASVKMFGGGIFAYCDSLKKASIADGITVIGEQMFRDCVALTDVTIPDSVIAVDDYAFCGCAQLPEVIIPDGVKEIGEYAFGHCSALQTVILPDSVETIGDSALKDCAALSSVTLPSGLKEIPWGLLEECTGLTSITIPGSVKSVQCLAFSNCTQLKEVHISEGVVNIWDNAFSNCDALEEIVIADSVERLGHRLFASCDKLSAVTIGKGVKEVGTDVCKDCPNLQYVHYTGTSEQWRKIEFSDDPAFPHGVTIQCRKELTITKMPENQVVARGKVAITEITATGDGVRYTWYYALKDESQWTESAEISNVFTSEPMSEGLDGCRVMCRVTDQYGNFLESSVAVLHMGAPVEITVQPVTTAAPEGSKAAVSVIATGDGLQYAWYYSLRGTNEWIKSSANTDTFVSEAMTVAWDYCRLQCVITDKYGITVASNIVQLRMRNPASIAVQPVNVVVSQGSEVKVTIKTIGDVWGHTWYYALRGTTEWVEVTDTIIRMERPYLTSSFTPGKMSGELDGCKVYCVVRTAYDTYIESDVVTLHMGEPAKIVTQPKSVVAGNGKTAKVSLKTTGAGLKYAWYYMKKGQTGYTKSESMTSNYFEVTMSSAWNGANVYCVVMDKYDNAIKSSVVTISMGNPVKITVQPANAVVSSGKAAKVTVKATGDGLKYQWYYAKKGSSKFTKDSATSASYSVKMSSSVDGRKVYCVVTDKYGNSVKTNTVTLYKGTPAKISTQPKSVTVANGKTGELTLKASGSSLKYQWYVKYKGASSYTKVGKSSNTYSFKMASKLDGAQAYCMVTDKFGTTVKSSVVTIKMPVQPKITTQPKSVTQVKGKTVKLTVKATGDGLKYQWYYAKKGSSSYKKLSGATKATYSVKVSSSVNGRKYYCLVTDKYGQTVKSGAATLTMKTVAKITTQPKNVSVKNGKTATVTVKATGDGVTYTWYYMQKGAAKYTKSTITKNTFSQKMAAKWNGCKVYCVVKDKYGNSVKSGVATLKMK